MSGNEGRIAFIGCYTQVPYVEKESEHGIYVIRIRTHADGTPTLEIVDRRKEKNITFFAHDSRRHKLYATSEGKAPLSALHSYDLESADPTRLTNYRCVSFEEPGAAYIGALDLKRSGGALLAIAFYEGSVVRIVEDEDNSSGGTLHLRDAATFINNSNVVKERQERSHPHAAYPLPSGDRFLVPDLGADACYLLKTDGKRVQIEQELKMPRGSGPRHVLLHPNQPLLFVVSELSNTLSVYETDEEFSRLTLTDEQSTLGEPENSYKMPNDSTQTAAHLQLSASGEFVLVSNRGRHNSISVFRLKDARAKKLELVGTFSTHGHFPRYFELFDNDQYLLVGNQLSHNLKLYNFDRSSGHVSGPIATLDVANPAAIVVV